MTRAGAVILCLALWAVGGGGVLSAGAQAPGTPSRAPLAAQLPPNPRGGVTTPLRSPAERVPGHVIVKFRGGLPASAVD